MKKYEVVIEDWEDEFEIIEETDDIEKAIEFIKQVPAETYKTIRIDELDENRIKACIIYIMQQISYKNGDTYLTIEEIYDNLTKYLKEELYL